MIQWLQETLIIFLELFSESQADITSSTTTSYLSESYNAGATCLNFCKDVNCLEHSTNNVITALQK